MRVDNKLYEKQGIHVISAIFTVDNGITKVLLVKRSNKPYKDMWALPGGALYNNERLEDGVKREIYEKTGIKIVIFTSLKHLMSLVKKITYLECLQYRISEY